MTFTLDIIYTVDARSLEAYLFNFYQSTFSIIGIRKKKITAVPDLHMVDPVGWGFIGGSIMVYVTFPARITACCTIFVNKFDKICNGGSFKLPPTLM